MRSRAAHVAGLLGALGLALGVGPGALAQQSDGTDVTTLYHFQVFALDTRLDVPFGAERDELLAAMQGHVLAAGEIVGSYQQRVSPLK